MRRLLTIFSLYFQQALQYRSKALVYFLLSLVNCTVLLLFWNAAAGETTTTVGQGFSYMLSYYVLVLFVAACSMCYVENSVSFFDIFRGDISRYLLQPLPYTMVKLFQELPWRLMAGTCGLIVLLTVRFVTPSMHLLHDIPHLFLFIVSLVLAFLLSFYFKMIVGISAFWITSITGIQEFVQVGVIVFAGFMAPLSFFPPLLQKVANFLPFPSMVYIPVTILMGDISIASSLPMIAVQLAWLGGIMAMYQVMLRRGIKTYGGVS